jgi:hypothetical protein
MSSQFARRAAISAVALAALLSGACKNSSSVTTPQPAGIAPSNASNDQIGTAGKFLGRPVEVYVTDPNGNPVGQSSVTWTVAAGSGVINGTGDTTALTTTAVTPTDSYGYTSVIWELGPNPGTDSVTATTADGNTTTIIATAQAATSSQVRHNQQ